MKRIRWTLPLATLLVGCAPGAGATQNPSPTPTPAAEAEVAEFTVLAGVYTRAQATEGRAIFQEACTACHSGGQFSDVLRIWRGRSVHEFLEQVRSTMPNDAPGRLSRQEYTDLVAYILSLNGYPAGDRVLEEDVVQQQRIRIVERPR